MFIWLVINDVPRELGEIEIRGVFSNKKAAECEVKCLRQIDDYANQYTKSRSTYPERPFYTRTCECKEKEMKPFNKMIEAYEWVEHHAQSPVGVIQSNARIMMTPWCRGDMRVLGIFFEGVWQ